LARGVVYAPERARAAMENFFKESTLVALRELAMRQAAYSIESRLPDDEPAAVTDPSVAGSQPADKLLLLITANPSSAVLIRRGRRVADYLRAECLGVYLAKSGGRDLSPTERESLERHLAFARGLQIESHELHGVDLAAAIVEFARCHGVTQIFVMREPPRARRSWFASAFVQRLVNLARDMQVTVVADRSVRRSD
jgi:two-component system sensor histidine kinase KdpD